MLQHRHVYVVYDDFLVIEVYPLKLYQTMAANFVADETQNFSSRKGVQWHFNLQAAPWWGGMFERLVRSTKRCLKKTLHNARLTYEELLTVLSEIQAVINNRPLTFLYDEPADEALTPNHLLFGRKINFEASDYKVPIETDVSNRYIYLQSIIDHYWKRWRTEYLTELREHHKVKKGLGEPDIEINDVVIIEEDKQPRQNWRMGVVQEFVKSRDNKRRGAVVRYINNDKNCTIRRPINKLYPVEYSNRNLEDKIKITFVDERNVSMNM